ncbi:MAG: SPOR domain-containing protein [Desulfuromonadales bacterium]|nr:SPOR domain-containing protein [Desulfuromonadales bacterium]
MAVPIMSRSQRRVEKKQALLLLALVLGVSLVSFTLGVLVGRGSAREPVAAAPERLPVTVPKEEAPATAAIPDPPPLTFYDTLPRGEQTPMGSGINLPPKEKAAVAQVAPPPAPVAAAAKVGVATKPAPVAPVPDTPKISPASATVEAPKAPPSIGSWMVQTASFRASGEARKLQEKLQGKGYVVLVQQADLGEKGTWYRVVVGPFASQSAADQAAARLKSEENLTALVRRG